MSDIIDGRKLAKVLRQEIAADIKDLSAQGRVPGLIVLTATDDEPTRLYVKHIEKSATSLGLEITVKNLGLSATTQLIAGAIRQAADNPKIHGIILQTPLPSDVNIDYLRSLIPEGKDIDGASPLSLGKLMGGQTAFAPSTAAAVLYMLKQYDVALSGKRVVVVGRSLVVGKPVALMLLAENATVTVCHSQTADLASVTKEADVLIIAIGKPRFLDSGYVKPGATVIDVGTNVTEADELVGDVDDSVQAIAGAVSVVPGGVGPVTTAILLKQTVEAAKKTL